MYWHGEWCDFYARSSSSVARPCSEKRAIEVNNGCRHLEQEEHKIQDFSNSGEPRPHLWWDAWANHGQTVSRGYLGTIIMMCLSRWRKSMGGTIPAQYSPDRRLTQILSNLILWRTFLHQLQGNMTILEQTRYAPEVNTLRQTWKEKMEQPYIYAQLDNNWRCTEGRHRNVWRITIKERKWMFSIMNNGAGALIYVTSLMNSQHL